MKIIALYFSFFLVSSYFNVGTCIRKQVNNQYFDHYILAMQWPPFFGSNNMSFSIHGLWPKDSLQLQRPELCTQEAFNPKVASQVPNLAKIWPSYGPKQNMDFWKHEWNRHGTCSGLSQVDYFNLAIVLAKKFDLAAVLKKAGVVSNGNVYVVNDFLTAFQTTHANTVPKVVCGISSNNVWIREFRFNYTNDDDTGAKAVLQSIVGRPYTPKCGGTNVKIRY